MEVARSLTAQGDITIHYRLWRQNERRRPLIVLLHGMASNITRWSEFMEYTSLKNDWDMLRVDLRGHGESFYRGKLSAPIWCLDLVRILDAEGYSKALLIGHSLGAQIAMQFAHTYWQRASGLVLIDPVLGKASRGITLWAIRLRPLIRFLIFVIRTLNRLGLRRRLIGKRDLRALDQKMRATLLAAGKLEQMVREYSSPWPDLKHFPTASYLEEILEMVRPLPALAEINVPVLVVLSKGVTYTDPAITRELIAQFPRASTVVIDAYHWPLTERPVEVREAIEAWCVTIKQGATNISN
ncbi:MAG: alpha/beta fold hydrolase [Acidiferrobacterales bacterium]